MGDCFLFVSIVRWLGLSFVGEGKVLVWKAQGIPIVHGQIAQCEDERATTIVTIINFFHGYKIWIYMAGVFAPRPSPDCP